MLDENLRVLGRRIHEMELDLQDKKERIELLETEKFRLHEELSKI